ncbi:hypothetical protein [Pedobacter sp.]|uniref:hypothetical protein n=1 Tax=Pedobacter sp. TaxID=1411316 RepID=UPI0031D406A5
MTLSYIIVFILVFWFTISVLYQIPRVRRTHLKIYDSFSLVPAWSFFAPNPGTSDYHLLYRDKLDNDSLTVWKESNFEKTSFAKAFWNPNKRKSKTLFDVIMSFTGLEKDDAISIKYSLAYLMVLNHVSNYIRHSPFSKSTQFIIVEKFGYISQEEPKIIFVSEFHDLPC